VPIYADINVTLGVCVPDRKKKRKGSCFRRGEGDDDGGGGYIISTPIQQLPTHTEIKSDGVCL